MEIIKLPGTDLRVSRTGFGALPIQRISFEEAGTILRRAYDAGITFYDTARGYSDSEAKIGCSLADVRQHIVITTKTNGTTRQEVMQQLEVSLKNLKTDYVDILQLHTPSILPDPDDTDSSYAGLLEARKKGMIRYLGLTNHRLDIALKAACSRRYATVQFPLSYISSPQDLELIGLCKANNVGVIAMKALCGGLITNTRNAFAFLRQYENVIPIWGIQRLSELQEFLSYEQHPPVCDQSVWNEIKQDRNELAGEFCRGCGYCMPCPADIPIPMAARMSLLLKRAPANVFLSPEWQEKMNRIPDCRQCGQCKSRCPYELDIPTIVQKMYEDYLTYFV